MNIQWYPGHMAKTRKMLEQNLKLVDIVIELLDARIPASSKNPEIDKIVHNKPKIIAFNKSDLADEFILKKWSKWYNSKGLINILIDSKKGSGINVLKEKIRGMMSEKIKRDRLKGKIFTSIRTMIVGIPNVGKSSFINRIAGRASTVTGDRPGVTRGTQWIRVNKEIQLLDTPGILWPKFDDEEVGLNLAFTGAIKDEIYDTIEVAAILMEKLCINYSDNITKRYKIDYFKEKKGMELLMEAGKNRGCLTSGAQVDWQRIASIVLDEFRGGKLGRICLETP